MKLAIVCRSTLAKFEAELRDLVERRLYGGACRDCNYSHPQMVILAN